MFINILTDYLKEKASSTILFSLFFFYILCNSRWIFTAFFTDQNLVFEKYGLLKNEYIYQNYVELHFDSFWFWFCTIIAPFVLTYLYVWWIPKIVINPAFKRQLKYQNERRKFKIEEENKLLNLKNNTIKEEAKNTDAMIELEDKKNKLNKTNPEVLLDEEYRTFQSNQNWVVALNELQNIVYGNHGNIVGERKPDILTLLDVNGLIDSSGVMDDSIYITEKGKAFLKRALADNLFS